MANALDIGFDTNPAFDNTPALNAFYAGSEEEVYFPPGHFYFHSKPDICLKTKVIRGHSMSTSHLIRTYQAASENEGVIHIRDGAGSRVENLGIVAKNNTSGGCGLFFEAISDAVNADYSTARNLYISSEMGSTWSAACHLSGLARTTGGLRDITLDNLHLFSSTNASLYCNTVANLTATVGLFSAYNGTGKLRLNANPIFPCSGINIRAVGVVAALEAWNAVNTVIVAPGYQNVNVAANSNVRLL